MSTIQQFNNGETGNTVRTKINSNFVNLNNDKAEKTYVDSQNLLLGNQISTKVDKVSGKGLSTNDYIDNDKIKLSAIEEGAQVNDNLIAGTNIFLNKVGKNITINSLGSGGGGTSGPTNFNLFTATQGQTTFTPNFIIGGNLLVFTQGGAAYESVSYNISGNSLVFNEPFNDGDLIGVFSGVKGDAGTPASGGFAYNSFIANSGQTIFNLDFSYENGSNNLIVFNQGAVQKPGVSYIQSTSTSITFNEGLNLGDEVLVFYIGVGIPGQDGVGVPNGGTTGQILAKNSNSNYDFTWINPPTAPVSSVNSQTGAVVLTTSDINDSTNKRYITDSQLTNLGNTSGVNSGDETTSSIKTKLGTASTSTDGYLTSTDWNTFNNKQSPLGYTPENEANKSTNTTLGNSNILYPTQNAVKTYVDTLDAQNVKITGNQTIAGTKTFSSSILTLISGNQLYISGASIGFQGSNTANQFNIDNGKIGADTQIRISKVSAVDTTALCVKSTGNILIGTTTDDTVSKLQIPIPNASGAGTIGQSIVIGNTQTNASTLVSLDSGTSAQGHKLINGKLFNASTAAYGLYLDTSSTGTGTPIYIIGTTSNRQKAIIEVDYQSSAITSNVNNGLLKYSGNLDFQNLNMAVFTAATNLNLAGIVTSGDIAVGYYARNSASTSGKVPVLFGGYIGSATSGRSLGIAINRDILGLRTTGGDFNHIRDNILDGSTGSYTMNLSSWKVERTNQTNSNGTLNAQGSVGSFINNSTQTNGTLNDTVNVLQLTQSSISTGALIKMIAGNANACAFEYDNNLVTSSAPVGTTTKYMRIREAGGAVYYIQLKSAV